MLIDALESGITSYGKPLRTIDSLLSKVFIFSDVVLKVYKHRKAFYGDLGEAQFRRDFYTEDFRWNLTAAPDIYVALREFNDRNEVVESGGVDLAIEMRPMDAAKNLTNLLPVGAIDEAAIEQIIEMLVSRLSTLTNEWRENLKELFEINAIEMQHVYLDDLRQWLLDKQPRIPKLSAESIISALKDAVSNEEYFKTYDNRLYSASMDTNSDNVLYLGKPGFIDIVPPKKSWRVNDPHFCIIRTQVDAAVLGNESLANKVRTTREKLLGSIPRGAEHVYEIQAACIQWAYRLMLNQPETAAKFEHFVKSNLK